MPRRTKGRGQTCRLAFLLTCGLGLRRGELSGSLRAEETFVRGAVDMPKSERSERTLASAATHEQRGRGMDGMAIMARAEATETPEAAA